MYKHILVPTDGTERSEKAVRAAVQYASDLGSRITFVSVIQPLHSIAAEPHTVGEMSDDAIAFVHQFLTPDVDKRLDAAQMIAENAGVDCETVQLTGEHIYQAIIDAAADHKCDLIAMASHGRRGLSSLLLGSETTKVLTHSTIPVLVYR